MVLSPILSSGFLMNQVSFLATTSKVWLFSMDKFISRLCILSISTFTWYYASLASAPSRTTSSAKARKVTFRFSFIFRPLLYSTIASSRGSKHKLNSNGDRGSPCWTPQRFVISIPPSLVFMLVLHSLYMSLIKSTLGAGTPFLARHGFSAAWGTVSKAFEISTIVNIPPFLL